MKEVSRIEMTVQMDQKALEALKKGSSEDQEEMRELFHRLWTRDVGTPGYSKTDWNRLGELLAQRGVLM